MYASCWIVGRYGCEDCRGRCLIQPGFFFSLHLPFSHVPLKLANYATLPNGRTQWKPSAAAQVSSTFLGLAAQSAKAPHNYFLPSRTDPKMPNASQKPVLLCRTVPFRVSRTPQRRHPVLVQNSLQKCNEDVQELTTRLANLPISDDEKRSGRYWKKIKTAFKEKDLARMAAVVRHHTSSLTLQLNILRRYCHYSRSLPYLCG